MTPGGSGGSVRVTLARISALVALVVVTLACVPSDVSTPARTAGIETPAAESASPLVGDGAIDFAITDLVETFGYDPKEVTLETIEAVEWPDSALGCPQAGQDDEPGPTSGYRIVLRVDDETYDYHGAAGDSEPFRCPVVD